MIFSSKRDGRLEIVNMRLQRIYRSVERELFILLIVTTSDLAETHDAENDALRDYGCTWMPPVLFILLRARRGPGLGRASAEVNLERSAADVQRRAHDVRLEARSSGCQSWLDGRQG